MNSTDEKPVESESAAGELAAGTATQNLQSEVSVEEQMERFEEALKESDWGHQPC